VFGFKSKGDVLEIQQANWSSKTRHPIQNNY